MSLSNKRFILWHVVLWVWCPFGIAQDANADWQWVLEEPPKNVSNLVGNKTDDKEGSWSQVEWYRDLELSRIQFRKRGLKFWETHPDDPRRYEWLLQTIEKPPFYWQDVDQGAFAYAAGQRSAAYVDEAAKQAWNVSYARLRAKFLFHASQFVSDEQRQKLQHYELLGRLRFIRDSKSNSECGGLLMSRVVEYCYSSYAMSPNGLWNVKTAADMYMQCLDGSVAMQRGFLSAMEGFPNQDIRILIDGWDQITRWRAQPVNLLLETMDGATLDLNELRGKVVLIDFWSTNCASCVEAMPEIKRVYDDHHKDGFEVVGVVFNNEKERERVAQILRKLGVTWPQSMQGSLSTSELAQRLGFYYVPWTFLLDQNGLLVTTDVRGPKLEQEVRRLLALPSLTKAQSFEGDEAEDPLSVESSK